MKKSKSIIRALLFLAAFTQSAIKLPAQATVKPLLTLRHSNSLPVFTTCHPDAAANKFGFEGGTAVKIDSTYYIFTSEMIGDPIWVKMRFGHWISTRKLILCKG